MSYTRTQRQNGHQPRRDQKDDRDRKIENEGRRDFGRGGDKRAFCGYCGRKGKHNPQKITQNEEKDVQSAERRTNLQKSIL